MASLLIAVLFATGWFFWLGDVGIDILDGGFLWYGAIRTHLGDVPLRDFQSYEPGRYYWAAAFIEMLGPGLVAVRASAATFLALGLTAALQVVGRVFAHPGAKLMVGFLLMTWAFPPNKFFEPSIEMAAVWVGVRLAERPEWGRHFQAGVFVGLAAFFGRNHALYIGLGLACVILWTAWKRGKLPFPRALGAYVTGGLLGALPLLAMLAFVPGFADSFLESLIFFLHHGANLPIPVPWPWRLLSGELGGPALGPTAVGLVFLLAPLVIATGLLVAWRGDAERPAVRVVVAATLLGLFYAHHAAVRSDVSHLAQAITPVLLTAVALPVALRLDTRQRIATWILIAMPTVVIGWTSNRPVELAREGSLIELQLGSDPLRVQDGLAQMLVGVMNVVERHVGADEPLLIVPYAPGLYPILDKEAPIWGLYLLWKADPEEEREMLREIDTGEVDWALVWDVAFGSAEFRFRNTHPLVWKHLSTDFQPVRDRELPPTFMLFRRHGREGDSSSSHSSRTRTTPVSGTWTTTSFASKDSRWSSKSFFSAGASIPADILRHPQNACSVMLDTWHVARMLPNGSSSPGI